MISPFKDIEKQALLETDNVEDFYYKLLSIILFASSDAETNGNLNSDLHNLKRSATCRWGSIIEKNRVPTIIECIADSIFNTFLFLFVFCSIVMRTTVIPVSAITDINFKTD